MGDDAQVSVKGSPWSAVPWKWVRNSPTEAVTLRGRGVNDGTLARSGTVMNDQLPLAGGSGANELERVIKDWVILHC